MYHNNSLERRTFFQTIYEEISLRDGLKKPRFHDLKQTLFDSESEVNTIYQKENTNKDKKCKLLSIHMRLCITI